MRILPPTSASLSLARIRNVYYSSAAASSSSSSSTTTTAVHRHISLLIGGMASIYGSAVSTTTTPPVTLCEDNNNNSILDKLTKAVQSNSTAADWNTTLTDIASTLGTSVQTAIDTGIPTQLSYGFLSGYCSGLALKKVGRAAAVVFGMGFVTLQTLQYSGYIQVDHRKLRTDVEKMLDLDKDGTIDHKDATVVYNKLLTILQYNMPGGGGFVAGFVGGLRSG